MAFRARFTVQSVTKAPNGVGEIRLTSSGAEGNEQWAKGAAHGEMRFTVTNEDALNGIAVGQVYEFTLEQQRQK
jgi:hypothetical protein